MTGHIGDVSEHENCVALFEGVLEPLADPLGHVYFCQVPAHRVFVMPVSSLSFESPHPLHPVCLRRSLAVLPSVDRCKANSKNLGEFLLSQL